MENKQYIINITRASMLLVFAIIIIFIGSRSGGAILNQFVIGPLVNGVIILAVLICDMKYGILIGLLTPVIAGLTGQLAQPMIPFSPFIMLGNVTLALVFGLCIKYMKSLGIYIGIAVGAVFKTLVLVLSVKYLVSLFNINLPQPVMSKLAVMMSYPQLYSAIGGGIVSILFYSIYKKYILKK